MSAPLYSLALSRGFFKRILMWWELKSPTFNLMQPLSNTALFETMLVLPEWRSQAHESALVIEAYKDTYRQVGAAVNTKMPWYFLGILHMMESGCNFRTHLHNGDSLKARTVQVPAGRPLTGKPPFTWQQSAIDACNMKGYNKWQDWGVADMLIRFELWNGLAYKKRGMPSPYLWSGSQHWTKGKYVADGKFDPNAGSSQVGAALLLKMFI